MNNTPPTTGTTTYESPERRAEVIAAIHALGDFLKAHPELPAPSSVRAQYSLTTLDADGELLIRRVADALGATPKFYVHADMPSGSVEHEIASGYSKADRSFGVTYTVHGMRRPEAAGGAA